MEKIISVIIITLFLLITSCNNNSNLNNSIDNYSTHEAENPFLEVWMYDGIGIPVSAKLVINKDSTFEFISHSCQSVSFSNGKWDVENQTIILSSNTIGTCYYVSNFYNKKALPFDTVKRYTTIKNCTPENDSVYVIFEQEQFFIEEDTLHYIIKNDKSEEKIVFYKID